MQLSTAIAAARAAERAPRRRFHERLKQEGIPGLQSDLGELTSEDFGLPVSVLGWGDPLYPPGLRQLAMPPPALFVRGPREKLAARSDCVALVGARRASEDGLRLAYDLAVGLAAEGLTVVSGLALGVDAAAHCGALDAGGCTVAVLASSVSEPTPRRHDGLAARILASGGALVSERPPRARVRPEEFPRRNRLVAGLVGLLVVVEAGLRSGTLSTVEHALDLGVEVAAVPGPVQRPSCVGSNALLRRGASWVESVDDVLQLLGKRGGSRVPGQDLDRQERAVLEGLPEASGSPGRWVAAAGLPPEVARGALARLVARGVLRRLPGGRLGRVL